MGLTGVLSRAFLLGANRLEVQGLDDFLQILDRRKDIDGRERGLITGVYIYNVIGACWSVAEWLMLPLFYCA